MIRSLISKIFTYKVPMIAILTSSLILCVGALYNRFPFTFNSDTACYIESGFTKVTWPDRSMLYGLFLYYASFQHSLWFVVVIQALIISLIAYYYFRYFLNKEGYLRYYLVFMVVAGVFMNATFDVSRLLADVFAPVCIMCFGLLLFVRNMPIIHYAIVAIIAFVGIGMHNTVFFVCIGLFLVILFGFAFRYLRELYSQVGVSAKRVILCLILAVAGNTMLATIHYNYGGGFRSSKSGAIFFMGNLVDMGVLDAYLAENCDDNKYALCHYRDTLPYNFLWAENSPIYKAGGWEAVNEEYSNIVGDILTRPRYLKNVLYKSCIFTGKQFFQFDSGEADPPSPRVQDDIRIFFPADYDLYTHSLQFDRTVNFDFINHTKSILAGTCFLIFVLGFQFFTPKYRLLILYLLVAMLINAWICGTVSVVSGRYQARLIWLLPLPIFLYAMDRLDLRAMIKRVKCQLLDIHSRS